MYNFAMNKNALTVIGMMSGTSLDGIDACLVEIDDDFGFKILNSHSLVYPPMKVLQEVRAQAQGAFQDVQIQLHRQ